MIFELKMELFQVSKRKNQSWKTPNTERLNNSIHIFVIYISLSSLGFVITPLAFPLNPYLLALVFARVCIYMCGPWPMGWYNLEGKVLIVFFKKLTHTDTHHKLTHTHTAHSRKWGSNSRPLILENLYIWISNTHWNIPEWIGKSVNLPSSTT